MHVGDSKNQVGFASLARRIKDLPENGWVDTDPAALDKAGTATRLQPAFDDGSIPVRWHAGPIPWRKLALFGIAILIVYAVFHRDLSDTIGTSQGEQQPPAGSDHILSPPQIRFCEFEKIRLAVLDAGIDNWFAAKKFKDRAARFNASCTSYRYRKRMRQSVQDEIPSMKPALEIEAKKTLDAWGREFNTWLASDDGGFFYMPSSVRRSANIARVAILLSDAQGKKTAAGTAYKSVKTVRYFDCVKHASATTETVYFRDVLGKGVTVEAAPIVPVNQMKFVPVELNSPIGAQLRVACVRH